MRQRLERKISFLVLFIYLFIYLLSSAFLVLFFLLFLAIRIFFSPHFSIRIFPSAMYKYQVLVLQIPKWNPWMRESLVMTSAYKGTPVLRTDFEGGIGEGLGVFWDWGWSDWR